MDIIFMLANHWMWWWHVYRHTRCDRGDQSPHHSAWLVKWEYALINSVYCGGQSLLLAVTNNLTTKVNNNTKRSLCPQKDALSTEIKVPKDTHTPVQTLPLCFAFNSVLGLINTAKSTTRYSQKSERWKSKSTKSEIVGESLWQTKTPYSLLTITKPLINSYRTLHIIHIYSTVIAVGLVNLNWILAMDTGHSVVLFWIIGSTVYCCFVCQ